ncbi:MAG: ankyrin repeat domain-containing protein [Pseudomonadota bacterium]
MLRTGLALLLLWALPVFAQEAPSLADRALLQSAAAGLLEESRYALEQGAEVDARGPGRETPLILASAAGNADLAKLLLDSGADPAAVTDDGWSGLHAAAYNGAHQVAGHLIAAGTPLELRERDFGNTALLLAARRGSHGVVAALLDAGAEIEARDERNGNTALINAAFDPLVLTTLAELIGRGADLDARASGDGLTALMAAVSRGNLPGAELLVASGAPLETANRNGYRALHLAASLGDLRLIDLLLERGAEVGAAAPDGETPLGAAVGNGELAAVRRLLEAGADPAKAAKKGRPPLHQAAIGGHTAVALALLSRDVDVNQRMAEIGNTALMLAANRGFLDIVELLLAHGADPNLTAADGWTALEAAEMFGDPEVIAVLKAAGTRE